MGHVVIADYWYENTDEERKIIEGAGHTLETYHCRTEDELIEAARNADVLIVQFAKVTERVIQNLEKCSCIVRYAIGVDIIDVDAATKRGIYVCNVPDYCIDEVSNHAIAMLMALSRKLPQISNSVKDGNWDYRKVAPVSKMLGSTLGVIGFGRIGARVSDKMSNFGVDIITCDPWIHDERSLQHRAHKVDLETLLRTSDYISLHVPLEKATNHLLDDAQFSIMKKGVILVNTSRGPIINEEALIRALDSGIVAGAGLDVFEKEPLPISSPLRNRENVIVTPHFAWYSEESVVALQRSAAAEAVRVLNGEPPKNLINKCLLVKSI